MGNGSRKNNLFSRHNGYWYRQKLRKAGRRIQRKGEGEDATGETEAMALLVAWEGETVVFKTQGAKFFSNGNGRLQPGRVLYFAKPLKVT